jgi:hypothetical protein
LDQTSPELRFTFCGARSGLESSLRERRVTARACVNSIGRTGFPEANFPYAEFAVKTFPVTISCRFLFDRSAKDFGARGFCIEMAMTQRRSLPTKNAGDGSTIARVPLKSALYVFRPPPD